MLSLSNIFCKSKFSRVAKNWVDDAITFSVNKIHTLNFEDMKKSTLHKILVYKLSTKCTETILIYLKFRLFLFDTNFMLDFWVFLLKTDVLVRKFWTASTEVKVDAFFRIFTICRKEDQLWPRWEAEKYFEEVFDLPLYLYT